MLERIAAEKDQDCRDRDQFEVANYSADMLVFVDELAANEHITDRKWVVTALNILDVKCAALAISIRRVRFGQRSRAADNCGTYGSYIVERGDCVVWYIIYTKLITAPR